MSPAAAVLLSGGLDSTTVLAIARSEGFQCHCLTVDYGQRHHVELHAARAVARALGAASHRELKVDLRALGGSALTADVEVPKDRQPDPARAPVTYVPARNTVLLALLLGLAEVAGARDGSGWRSLGTAMASVRAEPPNARRSTLTSRWEAAPRARATVRAACSSMRCRWP